MAYGDGKTYAYDSEEAREEIRMIQESETTPDRSIRALGANVIVERRVERKTAGGILIPDEAVEKRTAWARVVYVGPGRLLDDGSRAGPIVQPGDSVVIEKWEGIEFSLDGRELLLLDEGGVLGVVEE